MNILFEKIKRTLFITLTILSCNYNYSQMETSDEILVTKIEFETEDIYHSFYGANGSGSDNTFTPITSFKGNTYFVYIDALRRPILGKIENGQVTTSRLDKDDSDPYYVQDDGHNKFSIGVDKEGYIHVTGDLRNYGAQASMVYVDRYKDYNYSINPDGVNNILYWVSETPEDISSFEFLGGTPEKTIPGNGFEYPAFHSDMNGELYIRNKARVGTPGHYDGELAWTTARYNVETKSWTEIGGYTPDGFIGNEGNAHYQPLYKAVFWEDNGVGTAEGRNWYQGFAGDMRFDFNNRWHISTPINNDNDKEFMSEILYAYSDNGGETFYKADETAIQELPIRAEAGLNQGSIVAKDASLGYHLSHSVCFDKEGTPVITYTKFKTNTSEGASYYTGTYKYWNEENNTWSEEIDNPVGGLIRHTTVLDANGMISFISPHGGGEIVRTSELSTAINNDNVYRLEGNFQGIDQRGIREDNVLRGFLYDNNTASLKIVAAEWIPNLEPIPSEWTTIDFGNTAEENGMFHDIFQLKSTGTFDEDFSGQYVNQSIEGDFELQARIINVNYITDASFAGLMIRENNEESASYFGVAITSYEGVKTIAKDAEGFTSTQTSGYEPSEWLKITRTGNLLEAYRSDNGENWTKVDSKEIIMSSTVSYGLVTGSGNTVDVGHARIDHVAVELKDSSLSLQQLEKLDFSLYPNPTNGIINIDYANFFGGEKLQVIDIQGRVLVTQELEKTNSTVDISNLSPNVYFLKISNSKGQLGIKKLLIK